MTPLPTSKAMMGLDELMDEYGPTLLAVDVLSIALDGLRALDEGEAD